MTRALPLLLLLALGACGSSGEDSVSADEARQLNAAADATDINASGTRP